MRSAEYDAFGPWIRPVTSPEEVPPLYRGHGLDLAAARLVLKLPRDVARRDATPSMDLYDHLVIVDDSALSCRSRASTAPCWRTTLATGAHAALRGDRARDARPGRVDDRAGPD